jgi:hypothetical protein
MSDQLRYVVSKLQDEQRAKETKEAEKKQADNGKAKEKA